MASVNNQQRGPGGIPDSEQAWIRDRNVRREERRAAADDGNWNLEYVGNWIVVSGRGADEVRPTGWRPEVRNNGHPPPTTVIHRRWMMLHQQEIHLLPGVPGAPETPVTPETNCET